MTALEYRLRPAIASEIHALYEIHRAGMREYVEATFGEWAEELQREAFVSKYADLASPAYTLDVVLVDGEVAGYLHVEREADMVLLANIRVAPRWQRHGLGAALVEGVIAVAAPLPVELGVLRVNPARALYERLGFHVTEETVTHFRMRHEGGRQRPLMGRARILMS
jgi:GNAT superfamily N-acetyltransferase